MRFQLLMVLAALALAGCAASGSDGSASSSAESAAANDAGVAADGGAPVDGGPAVPTYAEEAPVITAHCGSCHNAQFGTLAKVQQDRAKMIQELQEQKMPKDDPSWSTSADGLELLDFLQSSPELN